MKALSRTLRKAADLANRLAGRITLIVPQVVPFPLPLETPPVLIDWNERRFRVIAEIAPVETKVQVYLCRDRDQALSNVLAPASLVVLGGRRSWWPTSETRLARTSRRAGHEVILAEGELGKIMLLLGMLVLGLVAFMAMLAFVDLCDRV